MALMRSCLGLCLLLVCLSVLHCASAWPVVRKGDHGPIVVCLKDLIQLRNDSGDVFTIKLEAAVKRYQTNNKQPVTGIVDAVTWQGLVVTLSGGRGMAVHAVQKPC
ncbi:hypothetical protein CBR_g31782 [Chara braunii]|uniref:Peptidoglycan binding-like domain-containing protein n=1 Tax=Chara braunii TaxID=69332 RepID=A0A388LFM0_CHABU|nr:hypothetical protein CBR_g31782 [Chara braunii]|eukprot:GBG81106.1 hypothetical protein CBR_g31782 [Chara braunii]